MGIIEQLKAIQAQQMRSKLGLGAGAPAAPSPVQFTPSPAPNMPYMPAAQVGPQSIPMAPGQMPQQGLLGGYAAQVQQILAALQARKQGQSRSVTPWQPHFESRPVGTPPFVPPSASGRGVPVSGGTFPHATGFVENARGPQQFGNNLGFSGRLDRQNPVFRRV